MITLYGSGPMFGLPEPCPYVLSAMTQLRMANLPFSVQRVVTEDETPLAREGEVALADGEALAEHLRRAHGVDLNAHLSCEQRAVGWALERMLEARFDAADPGDDSLRQARRDFAAAATLLGEKPFLFGERPSSADATLFAFAASAASPLYESRLREAAETHDNLVAHQWRIMDRFFEAELAE
jgi:glutathione S-transferase